MARFAVFIDAGYLLAWASERRIGARAPRTAIQCAFPALIVDLIGHCRAQTLPLEDLLRLYWYDGAPYTGPAPEQKAIGDLDDVKVRLGRFTKHGQKGVDTLLVLDLTTLARERALSSAFLLSGDEDLREGVLVAQQLGVRVTLLGLAPSAASGQAEVLKREVDRQSDVSQIVDTHVSNVGTPAFQAGLTFAQGWLAGAQPAQIQQATTAKAQQPQMIPGAAQTQLMAQVQVALNPQPLVQPARPLERL